MVDIAAAERIVVKVGSSSLTHSDGSFNLERVKVLADELAKIQRTGTKVVLVTSGAIAAALAPLRLTKRPRDLETQQAAAAVGQGLLIRHYTEAFARHDVLVAQVLLTVEDVLRPATYRNALDTISRLFRLGVVPIINENDTVATNEIRFGDNDRLAALVAHMVRASALFIFSDVDGLFTAHPDEPGSELIEVVPDVTKLTVDTSRVGSKIGTGGMTTKLEAARIATQAGVTVVLAHADRIGEALAGGQAGTEFRPVGKRRPRRLLWLAHAAQPSGSLHVDEGAVAALRGRKASLLAAGIRRVDGDFDSGEPVNIIGPDGAVLARGFSAYRSGIVRSQLGKTTDELLLSDPDHSRPVVHRDLLILV